MKLSPSDRFELARRLHSELESWPPAHVGLLFDSFAVQYMSIKWTNIDITSALGMTSDATIVELYSMVMKVPQAEVLSTVASGVDDSNWTPGYIRLFISHSAKHKEFVSSVADELAIIGVHGFVAHQAMRVTKPWQHQIEHALRSMQAFVAIVHPEFNRSPWCQEEVGWALGRRVPHYAVRMGADPSAFIGLDQWPSGHQLEPSGVASAIAGWIFSLDGLGESTLDALLGALGRAANYYDAEAAAKRLATIGDLPDQAWDALGQIYHDNRQVGGSVLVDKVLRPFYSRADRPYPPITTHAT